MSTTSEKVQKRLPGPDRKATDPLQRPETGQKLGWEGLQGKSWSPLAPSWREGSSWGCQSHESAGPEEPSSQGVEPLGAPGAYSMGGDGLPMGEQSHSGQEPLESVSSKPDPKTWVMLAVVPEKGASL